MPELHPSLDLLTSFGLGRTSDAESLDIEQHLSACEECRKRLEDIPNDSLVNLLQAPSGDTDPGTQAAAADTDSSFLSNNSLPPLYKRVAQILGDKPDATVGQAPAPPPPPAAKTAPKKPPREVAKFSCPRELEEHPRYQILAPLGAGGMGTVYMAEHRLMERTVAVKIVNPILVTKPGAAQRFTREVKAAAQLVHPNIVTAFDAEKIGDLLLLVMEYVEGKTLADVLAAGEVPVEKACEYIRQTAVGLQYALDRGMVHRDIKPHNLMLTPRGEIKILDFGLARFVSEEGHAGGSTEQGALMGSPDYMAPEQGRDAHSADERADIYSMGCTLYHLLAGQTPFIETSLLGKLEAHRDKKAIPLGHVRVGVPAELTKVVEKMMSKDPAQRYRTPAEVAAALAPFTQPHARPAAAETMIAPLPEERGKRPRASIVWACLVGLLLLVGGGALLNQFILRVETPEGTLTIKCDNPDVKVSVKQGGKEVGVLFSKDNKELVLKVGAYTLELDGPPGFVLKSNHVEIKNKNDLQTVIVDFVPKNIASKTPDDSILPRPPPLAEWRKGRTFLTVAQSGPADHRTILAAFKALKPGQYVKVLDKGPYRETLVIDSPPENIGLISDVGTRIEPERWHEWGPHPDIKGKKIYLATVLTRMNGFRLSGFEFEMPKLPADGEFAHVVEISSVGDAVVESCRVRFHRGITGNPLAGGIAADATDEFFRLHALVLRCFGGKGRFLIEDNLFDGSVDVGGDHPAIATVRRNWIRVWNTNAVLLPMDPLSDAAVTHNVIQGGNAVVVRGRGPDDAAMGRCVIANNVLEGNTPVWAFPLSNYPKDDHDKRRKLLRNVQVQNNIIRSAVQAGLEFDLDDQKAILAAWKVGHNSFASPPKTLPNNLPPLPLQDTDLIIAEPFLSDDVKQADYLRIPADRRQATAGVGGTYLGAFPPGPAPKDGDWFTRMAASSAPQVSPVPKSDRLSVDLSKIKPRFQDDFSDPKSGWRQGTSQEANGWRIEGGYDRGKYYLLHPIAPGGGSSVAPWGWHSNFAVEAVGRLVSPECDYWGVNVFWQKPTDPNVNRRVPILLHRNGECSVNQHGDGWSKPRPVPARQTGLKKLDDFHHLLVVVRGVSLEIYVDSIRVGDPIELEHPITPGVVCLDCGGAKGARAEFKSIKLWSADDIPRTDVSDIVAQAQAALDKNEHDKVITRCGDALRLDPENAKARYLRGLARAGIGEFALAIPDLSIVLERDPKNIDARLNRSYCYLNLNRPNECIDDATILLGQSPGHFGAHTNRMAAYASIGRFEKALADANDRIRQLPDEPSSADGFLIRGYLHRKMGNDALAKADIGRGETLDPALKGKPHHFAKYIENVVPQPPPLAEWLEGREVLTVSQDGKGKYKTIGAAIDDVKSGQVIKILDKGPYREILDREVPQNIGIISDVGTRIEWDQWLKVPPRKEGPKQTEHYAFLLRSPRDLRLHGLEFYGAESNADITFLAQVIADGDIVVESCSAATPGTAIARIQVLSHTRQNGNVWLRDCRFERYVGIDAPGSSVVVERCVLDSTRSAIYFIPRSPPREFVFRNNVVHSTLGVSLALSNSKSTVNQASWANTPVLIANNFLEATIFPILIESAKDETNPWYPKDVRIHNNIISGGRDHRGITLTNAILNAVKDSWKVSHNCYLGEPGGAGESMSFPRQTGDFVNPQPFLSRDPKDENYLRIAADSPLATKGLGGSLPTSIGPLPPGPAPKGGDWYSRLRVPMTSAAKNHAAEVALLLLKAQAASDKNDRPTTIALCDDAIRFDPDNIKALYLRGTALAELRQFDRALVDLDLALKRDPKHLAARISRSFVFLNTGRHRECLDDTNIALAQSPGSVAALLNRMSAFANLGRFDRALADANEGLRLAPNHADFAATLRARGLIHRRMGNEALATADIEKALALKPGLKDVVPYLGHLADIVAQPAPLDEWLAGKTIIKVSQDGKADCKTINEAIDRLKPHEVIEVLDQGPYQENVDRDLPQDTGIISRVGTRVLWTKWKRNDPWPSDPKKFNDYGPSLRCPRDFRLHGFEFVAPPPDPGAGFNVIVQIICDGNLVVESCRVTGAKKMFGRVDLLSWGRQNGNVWVRESQFDWHVLFTTPGSSIVAERNLFREPMLEGIHIFPEQWPRELIVRHNIFQSRQALRLGNHDAKIPAAAWADVPVQFMNNYVECEEYTHLFAPTEEGKKPWFPQKVRIQNNIFNSRDHRGIALRAVDLAKVKDVWQVSHNCYFFEPGGVGGIAVFPRHPNLDIVNAAPFLSQKESDSNHLRIAADSPLAKAGVGGAFPTYIGPLPPGPAPKEGDWYTRLRAAIPPPVRSPRELLDLARDAEAQKKDKEAIAHCDEILKRDPRHVDALWLRAACFIHLERWPESLRDLTTVLDIDPKSEARGNRVHVYLRMGKWDECIADADILMNRNPSNTGVLENRVQAYIQKGRLDLALGDYDQLAKLQPKVAYWQLCRGFVKERLGDAKEGRSDMRAAIAADPALKSARSPLPPFAWPEDSVRGNRIPTPDFSQGKNLYRDDFVDAREAPPQKFQALTHGVENGRYFMHHAAPGWPSLTFVPGQHDEVVCQVDGRVVDEPTCEWVLALIATGQKQSLKVALNGEGRVRVSIDDHGKGDRLQPLFMQRHPAVRTKAAFNTVTVIRRWRSIEVYVNGVAVCDPLEWDVSMEPVNINLGLQNSKPARVEFRNLSAWSAEDVPIPAERLAKKEAPVKDALKTSFAWPVDLLQGGKILAPTLGDKKPLKEDNFTDAKSGWGVGRDTGGAGVVERGYKDGKYFMRNEYDGWSSWRNGAFGSFPEMVCEVEGRCDSPTSAWALMLDDPGKNSHLIRVRGDGTLRVSSFDGKTHQPLFQGKHDAIKRGTDFNKLMVIHRAGRLEIFVNGVAVCDPVVVPKHLAAERHVTLYVSGKAMAEFQRLKIWSPEGLATPEERLAALAPPPVKKAVKTAWPADALREGRIPAPDVSKAKEIFRDDLWNPKHPAKAVHAGYLTYGYEHGCFYYQSTQPSWWNHNLGMGKDYGEVVFQVEGRVVEEMNTEWVTAIGNVDKKQGLKVALNGEGRVRVSIDDHGVGDRQPPLHLGQHPAILKEAAFNKVMLVRRWQFVEVYVNGALVCDPVEWGIGQEPVFAIVGIQNAKPGKVEFRNISIKSAEGVATPAERLARKEAPVKEPIKAPFAWPVAELREGKIRLPDLSALKVVNKDNFTDPKSGWAVGSYENGGRVVHREYKDGKYVVRHEFDDAWSGWRNPRFAETADFVYQAEGRIVDLPAASWALSMGSDPKKNSVNVRLNGEGTLTVSLWDYDKGEEKPLLFSGRHSAIKKGAVFNKLTAIYRSGTMEVFANDVAVCNPVPVDLGPLRCGFLVTGGRCTAEFQNFTVWSAEGLKSPEERSK